MRPHETRAALRLLYAVATADGTLSSEERRALEAIAEDLRDALDEEAVDIEVETAKITSEVAKLATFEAAIALAVIDGRCTPEEHAVLEKLRDAFALELPMPVAEREETWTTRTRDTRAAMRASEVDFLHTLAKRREGSLSPNEYAALVAELQRAQVETLRETLDAVLEGRPSYVVLPPA